MSKLGTPTRKLLGPKPVNGSIQVSAAGSVRRFLRNSSMLRERGATRPQPKITMRGERSATVPPGAHCSAAGSRTFETDGAAAPSDRLLGTDVQLQPADVAHPDRLRGLGGAD